MDKFDSLILKFANYLKVNGFSNRTIDGYKTNLQYFFNYLESIGIKNIAEVDRKTIMAYQTEVYLQTYKDKPITTSTQQHRLTAIKTFYRYLLKNGYVLYDPSASLEMPRQAETIPRDILTKKEIALLLSIPDLETPLGIRDRAIMELLYVTGIRTTEACNLTLNDLDLSTSELRINLGKNKKDRIVPLGEVACDYLELYLKEARPQLLKDPKQLALFITKNGCKMNRQYVSRIIRDYNKEAGIKKKITPYSFRHTCATHLLKGKADIRHIQQILGHESITTTQRYTRVEIADLKQVLKRCHPRERKEIDVNEF
jgi:integrase/recombinase XerD